MSKSVLSICSSKSFIVAGLTFRSLNHLSLFLCMVLGSILIPFFYMQLSSFPSTIYWRDCLFFIVYSCLLCHRLGGQRCMGLYLDFLFCSIDIYFCFWVSTRMFWWLHLCSIVWSQGALFLQVHLPFSRLLWLFGVICVSIQTVWFFVQNLWEKKCHWWLDSDCIKSLDCFGW